MSVKKIPLIYHIAQGTKPDQIIISIQGTHADLDNGDQMRFLQSQIEEMSMRLYEKVNNIKVKGFKLNGTDQKN